MFSIRRFDILDLCATIEEWLIAEWLLIPYYRIIISRTRGKLDDVGNTIL